MNESYFYQYLSFLMKSPLFLSILDTSWAFLGTFPMRPVSMIPCLLNWIMFWIESAEFFNLIIFWIESSVKQYIQYIELNIEWIIVWQNSNIESNQIGYRTPLLGPGKCFFGHFLIRLSRNTRSQVMSMRKFCPRALNFCYDFLSSSHFFGTPCVSEKVANIFFVSH